MSKVDEVKKFLEDQISLLKKDFPQTLDWPAEKAFAYICVKYYLANDDASFEDIVDSLFEKNGKVFAITNYAKDGSDAVAVAFFDSTVATSREGDFWMFPREIVKILESGGELSSDLEEIKKTYLACMENCGETFERNLFYFTGVTPKKTATKTNATAELRKKISEVALNFQCEDIHFGWEIKDWIASAQTGDGRISDGLLKIDKPGNLLEYTLGEDVCAVMVNISARSLKALYDEHGKNVLGLNLRYHVRGKKVDDGIRETIKNNPEWFWCLNNGMVVVCDTFELNGDSIGLTNFSIVNGGQTTTQVAHMEKDAQDFFIACKIVKIAGALASLPPDKVAVASNAQKPIKDKDLAANGPEQIKLKAWMLQRGWQYIIKQGEKIESDYKNQKISLDNLGKVIMASLLQMPWTKSNPKDLYNREKPYYRWIYGDGKSLPEAISCYIELVELNEIYKRFDKKQKTQSSDNPELYSVIGNCRTAAMAAIVLIAYYFQNKEQFPKALNATAFSSGFQEFQEEMLKMKRIFNCRIRGIAEKEKELEKLFHLLAVQIFNSVVANSGSETIANLTKTPGFYKKVVDSLKMNLSVMKDPNFYRLGEELFV